MTEPKTMCEECGELGDDVQHVTITWPGTKPFFVAVEDGFLTNPYADGRAVELHLHRRCEQAAIERLEATKQ
jgi:hypothetical protein